MKKERNHKVFLPARQAVLMSENNPKHNYKPSRFKPRKLPNSTLPSNPSKLNRGQRGKRTYAGQPGNSKSFSNHNAHGFLLRAQLNREATFCASQARGEGDGRGGHRAATSQPPAPTRPQVPHSVLTLHAVHRLISLLIKHNPLQTEAKYDNSLPF